MFNNFWDLITIFCSHFWTVGFTSSTCSAFTSLSLSFTMCSMLTMFWFKNSSIILYILWISVPTCFPLLIDSNIKGSSISTWEIRGFFVELFCWSYTGCSKFHKEILSDVINLVFSSLIFFFFLAVLTADQMGLPIRIDEAQITDYISLSHMLGLVHRFEQEEGQTPFSNVKI